MNFLKWGDDIAKKREGEILAGYTLPAPVPLEEGGTAKPDTAEAWQVHIQKQTGEDTAKAWGEFMEWGQQQETE
jgi:hypothetical protein